MNEFFKNILVGINSVVGNYGWSIVLFTLLIRLICFPFDFKSRSSMRRMTKLQPQMAALQKKYAKDPDKLNAKTAELYRKEHINPLSSCLPMLISMPILFIMFAAMRMVANENLVQQVFSILQGQTPKLESWLWVKNVWMPDSPFAGVLPNASALTAIPTDIWTAAFNALGDAAANLPTLIDGTVLTAESFATANLSATITNIVATMETIPLYQEATQVAFNVNWIIVNLQWMVQTNGYFILPVLSAVTQYLMTVLQPTTQAAAGNDAQAQSAESMNTMMKWFFPLFSLWICCSYNAVFAIYWVVSNIIAAGTTVLINMILDAKEKKQVANAEEVVIK